MMNETFLDHTHLVPQKHTTPSLNPIHIHLYIFVSSYTPVSYLTYTCTPYSLPTLLFLHPCTCTSPTLLSLHLLQSSYIPVPTPMHLYILQSSYIPVPTPIHLYILHSSYTLVLHLYTSILQFFYTLLLYIHVLLHLLFYAFILHLYTSTSLLSASYWDPTSLYSKTVLVIGVHILRTIQIWLTCKLPFSWGCLKTGV